ncbi:MAG: ABC transporter ATP-binding protein [Candidatus Hodarchaeales archaeon]|jgi:putative ABC transport system ATP-binding protein
MGPNIVETISVTKVYNQTTYALRDINLTINQGEWVTITGPSGSGKTTLLNIISCLDRPSEGSVRINGQEVTCLDQGRLTRYRRTHFGLIFQQYHLIPYLSALENVMLAQYYHGGVNEALARETLESFGLGHRLEHTPAHLSGGEQQRVCIARAIINNPAILVADEPTGNLDQKNGQDILDRIKKLNNEGHTIILVTHNPHMAELGDRTIQLIDGAVSKEINN